tara:strand:- start:453 stop:950 length:498 start_codon:yes stop_codon:yes gene_type:complete
MKYAVTIVSLLTTLLLSTTAFAQETSKEVSAEKQKLYELFEQKMSGVKLIGQFTILGKEQNQLPKEEYTIRSVKKAPLGEQWLFEANIKYGDKDVTVPLPIDVEWAGKTPVITLTDFTIPGMGTFSSRVVIYKNKYAGTWTHGKVGGHLFGTIEKLDSSAAEEKN